MILKLFACVLIILIFLKSLFYGIYELQNNNNKSAGSAIIVLSIIGLILPIVIIFIY